MTDDQHREDGHGRTPGTPGAWEPTGEYDSDATAFVQLPEGGVDELLAAPGHGYTPPRIEQPLSNPGGAWPEPPADAPQWPEGEQPSTGAQNAFEHRPGSTGQWSFPAASQDAPAVPGHDAAGTPGHDVTGQWSIPVADGDLPDESGEFSASSLSTQWGGRTPPATLPGGAAAPWAEEMKAWVATAEGTSAADVPEETGVVETTLLRRIPDPNARRAEQAAAREREAADESPEASEAAPHATTAHETAVHDTGTHPADVSEEHVTETAPYEETRSELASYEAARSEPASYEETRSEPASYEAARSEPAPYEAARSEPASYEAAEDSTPPEGTPLPHGTTPEDGPSAEPAAERHEAEEDDPEETEGPPPLPQEEHPLASYVLRVNGTDRPVGEAWIGESLLYVLRERLGLAGAKDGCSQGECGACNVQVDGRLVASCLVPAVTAAGSEVRTVEGLAADGQPSDVQRALARCGAVQCGFCIPGMAMTLHDLLEGNPAPTELETRQALCGNLCRCSGYRGVLEAVREVVAEREAHSEAEAQDTEEARVPHQAGPGAGGVHPTAYEDQHGPYHQDGGQA